MKSNQTFNILLSYPIQTSSEECPRKFPHQNVQMFTFMFICFYIYFQMFALTF